MKRLICVVCVLGFIGVSGAERNPEYKNWLTSERLARWQELSKDMTYFNLYTLMEEMYHLPQEPWSESLRQILLKMTTTYKQMLKDRAAGKPIIVPDFVASDKCGEIDGYLYDMVIWQKDSRFLFFFQNFGLGGAAVDGLAGIGEPAFEAVIKAFDREGYAVLHDKAAKTLDLMLQEEDSFLKTNLQKRAIAKQVLVKVARTGDWVNRASAIDALRFFSDVEVSALLETIRQTDSWQVNGQYPLRERAQNSLEYLQSH